MKNEYHSFGREDNARRQRRRAARSAARVTLSLSNSGADRRRNVPRRIRDLSAGRGACGPDWHRMVYAGAKRQFPFRDICRHGDRSMARRYHRGSLRPALFLSSQSFDIRSRVAGRRCCALDGMADRRPFCHGHRSRRGDRRWLCHDLGASAAGQPGQMGRGSGNRDQLRIVFRSTGRPPDHSFLRLALDVCDRGGRRADRLVSAQAHAGVAPLAGSQRTDRRSRAGHERDRSGGRTVDRPKAARGDERPGARLRPYCRPA